MKRTFLAIFTACFPAVAGAQQTPDPPATSAPVTETARPCAETFAERLTALAPSRPADYFLLAEEVADEARTPADRRLAVTLYVLAFELDRVSSQGGRLAAQCCVGLADASGNVKYQGWLFGMAQVLDPRFTPPEWLAVPPPTSVDSAAYQVASILGLVRSGDGGRARQLLQKPDIRAAFLRYDILMSRLGIGSASRVIREAGRWPCPECGNQRVTKVRRAEGVESRICIHCAGDPGARLSRAELLSHLRFESWLLHGINRSWAAQIATDEGAPLLDPEPEALAVVFEVDALALYWRRGAWCRSPDGSSPAQPPMPVSHTRSRPRPAPKPEAEAPSPSGTSGS